MRRRPKAYNAWASIKARCFNPSNSSFKRYGGRGITLQASWVNDSKAFCQYVEGLPSYDTSMTLERIDNDGDYVEGNLAWVPRSTQAKNRRKMSNNSSGHTGILIHEVLRDGYSDTYVTARWSEHKTQRSLSFNVAEYGLMPAFAAAVQHRRASIQRLQAAGEPYSAKHGK